MATTMWQAHCDVPVGHVVNDEGLRVTEQDLLAAPHRCEDFNCIALGSKLVAIRDLVAGEPLTINKNQCIVADAFQRSETCTCHGRVQQGFNALTEDEKQELFALASDEVKAVALASGFVPLSGSSRMRITDAVKDAVAAAASHTATRQVHAVADGPICEWEHIATVRGFVAPFAVANSIALTAHEHLLYTGAALFLKHSCTPNVRVFIQPMDRSFDLIALRDIADGETLTYDYNTTEWSMARPFECDCGAASCLRAVSGFKHLRRVEQERLLPYISPAVLQRMQTDRGSGSATLEAPKDSSGAGVLDRQVTPSAPVQRGDIIRDVASLDVDAALAAAVLPDGSLIPHSCEPNTALINGHLIALAPLAAGAQLTINAGLLRSDLREPFECHCRSRHCAGRVAGFAHLSADDQDRLMMLVEPDVRADAAHSDRITVRSSTPAVKIAPNGGMGLATFAARPIAAGAVVFHVKGLVLPFPTLYTICTAPGRHVLFTGGSQCMAHSCDPNVRIAMHAAGDGFDVLALRDVAADELISFNYLTTEYDMSAPFDCLCGSPKCFGAIRGYKHVAAARRAELQVTPALIELAAVDHL